MSQLPAVPRPPARTPAERAGLAALEAAILYASDRLPELAGDTEALALGITNIARLRAQLGDLLDQAEQMAYESLPEARGRKTRAVVEGVGTVEPVHAQRSYREWDKPRMLRAAVGVAMERGEINHPQDVVDVVLEVASVGGGKANYREGTGLVKYGLEREDFARLELGRPGVRIVT